MKFAKFLRTPILKNICERLFLFVSRQYTVPNSSGEFGLGDISTECKLFFKRYGFIRSNTAISFIYKLKNVSLTFRLTLLLNFDSARFLNSILHLVS